MTSLPNALALQYSKIRKNGPHLIQLIIIEPEIHDNIGGIAYLSRVLTEKEPNRMWSAGATFNQPTKKTFNGIEFKCDKSLRTILRMATSWNLDTAELIELDSYTLGQLKVYNYPSHVLNETLGALPHWGTLPKE